MIILLGAAGVYSYVSLGRGEDPNFTIKTHGGACRLAGARPRPSCRHRSSTRSRKKLQELPYLDRIEKLFTAPAAPSFRVTLTDKTPPSKVKELWYQVRKKVGDIPQRPSPGDHRPGLQ